MKQFLQRLSLIVAAVTIGAPAQTTAGDASRGAQVLRDSGCIACHKIEGQGGQTASDLGRRVSRNYTPAYLAGVMWKMWDHVVSAGPDSGVPGLSENQAADLFAYFVSRRYFEPLGDAGRGKHVFVEKHCNTCHGVTERRFPAAHPVTEWYSLRDPIAFAQELWNRPPAMVQAFASQGIHYSRISPQELNDLLVYLENLPVTRGRESRVRLAPAGTGRMLFQAKGCAACHQAKLSLENRAWRSMAEISAAMWNHPFAKREGRPFLSYDDMSGLVSYVWSLQDQGDRRRGRRVFARKKCGFCHDDGRTEGHGPTILAFSGANRVRYR